MNNIPGKSVASLRILAVALARDAVFGRQTMSRCSLSGRKGTASLAQHKMDYIKTLLRLRAPGKSDTEFEYIWSICRNSISKSCQGSVKRKL